ncbi:MAG TPA: ATP-binding protein [Chitinophagales bacterium]|nr:ATP-binding protein [Chitinophagales bacterium]
MSLVEKDYRLELDSNPESVSEIEPFVEQIRDEVQIPDELYANILVCLTEAVNNCIIHGNKFSPAKKVTVTCTKKDNVISFIAADEGDGFDYENLPDPTAPENIEKATGRGVYLMRQLSDYLKYTNGGATVEMRFNIQLQ